MQLDAASPSKTLDVPQEVLKEPKWLAKCLISASLPPPLPPAGSGLAAAPVNLKPLISLMSGINVAMPNTIGHKDRVLILSSIHLECIEWHCRSYLVSDRSSIDEKKAVLMECALLGRETMSTQPGAIAHLTQALSHLVNPLVSWALKDGSSKQVDGQASTPSPLPSLSFLDDASLVDAVFSSIIIPHLLVIDASADRNPIPSDLIIELLRLSSFLLKSLPYSLFSKHISSCLLICQKMEPWIQEAGSTLLPQSSSSSLLLNSCSILHHHALLFAATLLAVKLPQDRILAQDHTSLTLQVFEALLVRAQPTLGGESVRRGLIREAVDTLLPALYSIHDPASNLKAPLPLWEEVFSCLKRSLSKEDSYLVVVHCWQIVLRHSDCFYSYREQLVPSIPPLASRLFTHPVRAS
jgi:hypothetical protein